MITYFSKQLWNQERGRFEPGFLQVEKERISRFVFGLKNPTKSRTVDWGDFCVGPSGIDLHVHCRDFEESHKETFASCEAAAFKGGLSTVVAMANSRPRLDDLAMLKAFRERTEKRSLRFLTFAAVTKNLEGREATDWKALLKHPLVVGLSDDGRSIQSVEMMEKALRATKATQKVLSLHEEDLDLSQKSHVHLSEVSWRAGLAGSPAEAEVSMVERDLALALKLKAPLHLGHMSSQRSVVAIERARRQGLPLSAELTPHHALLNVTAFEDLSDDHKALFKVCPVIRSEDDRQALLKGARKGLLDCFASDHAPHSTLEKEGPYEGCMHGIVSLEYYAPLYFQVRREAGLSWKQFFDATVFRPASVIRSVLKETPWQSGSRADFMVFDPAREQSLVFERSRSHNSPLSGRRVTGQIQQHFLKGRKVYEV